jgi:amino acid adenylation domain-containing protein
MLPGEYLHEVFEVRVREAPNRIAVSTLDEQITYGDLDIRANRLAHNLRALGVGPDVLVGLCVDRSIDMIVGLLAILKAGGAYLPIDPTYPSKRIEFLLADSAVRVVLTVSRAAQYLGECDSTIVYIDEEAPVSPASAAPPTPVAEGSKSNLAYVIYTSGSTGKPKGVLVEHRNILRVFEQTQHWFHFDENDVWSLFHSISFDFSVWEIWGALLYGGRVVIVPYEIARTPSQSHSLLRTQKVTVLNQTPSAFRQLIAADMGQGKSSDFNLRIVIFGGEELDVKMLGPWVARYGDQDPALINMYGITEASTHVTYRPILREDLSRPDLSPIGVPIPDFHLHVLDAKGDPVQDGIPGELYVAGAGVARGYFKRPELTAQRFVPGTNEGSGGTRLYYSGDRVVRMPNGELAYLGRSDDQIKVRGFRIEPKEIEVCLTGHPEVATAVVMPHDYGDGDMRLVAFVIPQAGLKMTEQKAVGLTTELMDRAVAELPTHLRPSVYFVVSEIPMTAHGKVDKEALRQRIALKPELDEDAPGSTTTTAEVIAEIWGDVLQLKSVGTKEDFFDLGGTSLALLRILGRVNQHFNVSLDGSELVDEPTISRLASCVDKAQLSVAKTLDADPKVSEPMTPTAEVIAGIWSDVLQLKSVGTKEDFFDLGGTSLALLRILGRVNQCFSVSLDGSELVDEPTISRLASCVDAWLQNNQPQLLEKK